MSFLYQTFKRPIWITKFNCGGKLWGHEAANHMEYMQEALPVLEGHPWVTRYNWAATFNDDVPGAHLVNSDMTLSGLGQFYNSYEWDGRPAWNATTTANELYLQ